MEWAQKKLEREYNTKISDLQRRLYQEFTQAEQFQRQVLQEKKIMQEHMKMMEVSYYSQLFLIFLFF